MTNLEGSLSSGNLSLRGQESQRGHTAEDLVVGAVECGLSRASTRGSPLHEINLYETDADRRSHQVCMHYVARLEAKEAEQSREAALKQIRKMLLNTVH